MQELVYVAARVVESGRRLALKFSRHCPAFPSFEAVYGKLAAGRPRQCWTLAPGIRCPAKCEACGIFRRRRSMTTSRPSRRTALWTGQQVTDPGQSLQGENH
jgi:hypothetical protein